LLGTVKVQLPSPDAGAAKVHILTFPVELSEAEPEEQLVTADAGWSKDGHGMEMRDIPTTSMVSFLNLLVAGLNLIKRSPTP
jgi:hypothetical protein